MTTNLPESVAGLEYILLGDRPGQPGDFVDTPFGVHPIVSRDGIWATYAPDTSRFAPGEALATD